MVLWHQCLTGGGSFKGVTAAPPFVRRKRGYNRGDPLFYRSVVSLHPFSMASAEGSATSQHGFGSSDSVRSDMRLDVQHRVGDDPISALLECPPTANGSGVALTVLDTCT